MTGYVPATPDETKEMLRRLHMETCRELYPDIPQDLLLKEPPDIGDGCSEIEMVGEMRKIAGKNMVYRDIFMGAGAYRHFIPAAVELLASREEFVTAYTPYQAEMSQGILQGIFEFQTMICELTGMDAANASVYDGATAAGEACLMARDKKRRRVLLCGAVDPQVAGTIRTYLAPLGMEAVEVPQKGGLTDRAALEGALDEETAAVFAASPNYYGMIEDVERISDLAHAAGAKMIVSANPIASALLKPPGELGADIAVGEGQPLGIPLSFGGPYFGFMACTEKLMRKLPGRIVGETKDREGNRAFVLTLQAREQHIRREKAGSNICSNQAWCALRGAIYMSMMGKDGLREVAEHCYANAHYLKDRLAAAGWAPVYPAGDFFHEFVTACPSDYAAVQKKLDGEGILGGRLLPDGTVLWCATELTGKREIDRMISILEGAETV